MILHEIRMPNSLKIVPSGVANCRNLPFGGRATRGLRVRLPWEENAQSRHQCLFEEIVEKTGKVCSTKSVKRFGSCFYERGRYQHPTRPSQWTTAFNQVCKYDFNLFYFPFYVFMFFMLFFVFLSFCGRQGCFPCSYVFLNGGKEIIPTQFFGN